MIVGVLLAAGKSSRFGLSKSLATLPDGRTVLEAAVANLVAAVDTVVIVTRRVEDELVQVRALCERFSSHRVEFVINENAEEGMGTSIASGVAVSRDAAGWLVALGDMPFIASQTITALKERLEREQKIVVPHYHGERGHPVGFPANAYSQLLSLSGDKGARLLVDAAGDAIVLETEDRGVIRDIDTPADLPR